MLKIKIYATDALQMPEVVLEGKNTIELLDQYMLDSPVIGQYKTIYGRQRRTARYLGIPLWGVVRDKRLQTNAYLTDQMVKLGLAEWIEFNEDEFDPRKAIAAMRAKANPHPRTEEDKRRISAQQKARFAAMTPEEKAKHSELMRAGWRRRAERTDLPPRPPKIMSEDTRKKISATRKAMFAAMTPEEKARLSERAREAYYRWQARRAAEAEQARQETLQARRVASGRAPGEDTEVPEWFKMPKK